MYKDMHEIPLQNVNPIEIAELTKVVENSHRFMEIAFAEKLKMVCDTTGIDFEELRKAVNTKWNTKILEAKDGIGGHCLPKDSQMFLDFSKDVVQHSLLETAKRIDFGYRAHISRRQRPYAIGHELDNAQSEIGLSVDIVSALKERFNITEVEVQGVVSAVINKMVKDHPDELKSIITPKQKELLRTQS